MDIIPVTLKDLLDLQKISRTTFKEAFGAANDPVHIMQYMQKAFSEVTLRKEIGNPQSQFFFCKLDSDNVGYLKLNVGKTQTEDVIPDGMELERIYVLADFHGLGIGQKLLDFAIETALKAVVTSIWLGVWEENHRAIRFYQKNDFSTFDKHIFKFGDDDQTDLLMKRKLS